MSQTGFAIAGAIELACISAVCLGFVLACFEKQRERGCYIGIGGAFSLIVVVQVVHAIIHG
jgi:hypothetical protein